MAVNVACLSAHLIQLQELKKLKDNRSRNRDMRDLEERMLLDQITNMEPVSSPRQGRRKVPLSKHREVRDLQTEVEYIIQKR